MSSVRRVDQFSGRVIAALRAVDDIAAELEDLRDRNTKLELQLLEARSTVSPAGMSSPPLERPGRAEPPLTDNEIVCVRQLIEDRFGPQ